MNNTEKFKEVFGLDLAPSLQTQDIPCIFHSKYCINGWSCDGCSLQDFWTKEYNKEYQEPMWISVDDQLPEEYEDVLVCTKDGKIEKAYHTNKEWCEDGEMEWRVFETFGHAYILDDDDVVAWMPLPKPYQPESHELKRGLANADQDTMMPAT